MADPVATWGVGELHAALNEVIEVSFGTNVWVAGELRSPSRSHAGHVFFELVDPATEAGHRADTPCLAVTLFNGYRRRVNELIRTTGADISLREGTVLRICGELRTYEARSRIQLVMTGIDPTYTLGVLAQRREQVLAALAADGLLERNASLPLPRPALRLGLITSKASAAEADVLDELRRSGFAFHVTLLDARTQGARAEATIVAALHTAARLPLDAVVLVRGGGSRSDLQVFDSEAVARAIAAMPVPVLTGIGHETDSTVADVVAHTAYKTPTACAAALAEQARHSALDLLGATRALAAAARGRLERSSTTLGSRQRSVAVACRGHLGREQHVLAGRSARLAAAGPLSLQRREAALRAVGTALGRAARDRVGRSQDALAQRAALVAANDPRRALARGWSVTRDGEGRVVRSVGDVADGDTLVTQLADGTLDSRVTGGPRHQAAEGEGSHDG